MFKVMYTLEERLSISFARAAPSVFFFCPFVNSCFLVFGRNGFFLKKTFRGPDGNGYTLNNRLIIVD